MDFKTISKTIKPWLYLSAFTVIFAAVMFNFTKVTSTIGGWIGLFKPLFYGIAIAYVLNLPMKNIELFIKKVTKENSFIHKKSRGIAVLLTIVFAIILFSLLVSVIIPKLISSFVLLFNNFSTYLDHSVTYINDIFEFFNIDFDASKFQLFQYLDSLQWDDIIKKVMSWLGTGATNVISTSMGFIGSFGTWFTAFMLSLYLLTSKEEYIIQLKKVIIAIFKDNQVRYIFKVGKKANAIFAGFIGGQLVEAVILGVLCYIGMLIFKFPFPELISMIVGITSLVPMFGAMFGMAFGCLLIFAINPISSLLFIVYFQVLQQFEGNVIYPRVVGGSVGISGIYVLLSLVIFGALFGLIGMLIAVPMTALLYSIISEFVNGQIKKKNVYVDEKDYYIIENNKEDADEK